MDFWHKSPNSRILTEVDAKEFMVMFLSRVFDRNCDEIRNVLDQVMVSGEAGYEK